MKKHRYEIHTKKGGYYSVDTDYKMKINKKLRQAVFGKDAVVNIDDVSVIYKFR